MAYLKKGFSANTLTGAKGHVLQTVTDANKTGYSVSVSDLLGDYSNSYYEVPAPAPSITTSMANSKILILGHVGNVHASSGSPNCNAGLKRYKDGSGEALLGGANENDSYTSSGPIFGMFRHTAVSSVESGVHIIWEDGPDDPVGTVLQYTFVVSNQSGTLNWGYNNSMTSLTIMEIAP